MTTLKNHTYIFLFVMGLLGLILLYFHQYGRLVLAMALIPFLDPDQDQALGIHRFWFSHSIFPGILMIWCLSDIVAMEYWWILLTIFSGYSLIHLWGDLGSDKGLARIKLYPIKKTINNRLWIGGQTILFFGIFFFLI